MAMTLLRFTFRHVARDTQSPADLATRMSVDLYEEWHGVPYVTCLIARIDLVRKTITYANAGHPPGILVRGGMDRALSDGGPPLGLFPEAAYVEEQLSLRDGDVCTFMTDGITDAFDDGVRSGRTVVLDAVRAARPSARAICRAVMSEARAAHGPIGIEGWADDQTVVVVAIREAFSQRRTS